MSGEDEKLHRAALGIRPGFERPVATGFDAERAQIRVRMIHAVLELPERAVVIVQPSFAADLHRIVIGGHVVRERISVCDRLLRYTDREHIVAVVHAPDRFRAKLAEVEAQVRQLQIATPARDEVLQVRRVGRLEGLVEHVVLPLMPHEALDAIRDLLSLQLGQRRTHMLKRQRVKFEAVRHIRIPVLAQRRAARGHFDDRDGWLDALRHLFGKAQLRPEVVTRRPHRNPPLRSLHVLPPELVGEQDLRLRLIQPRERRKAMDVLHPRVRAHHVRLAREDENAQRLGVGAGAVGRQWSEEESGNKCQRRFQWASQGGAALHGCQSVTCGFQNRL